MIAPDFLRRSGGVWSSSWYELTNSHTARRFFVWSGVSGDLPSTGFPSAGGSVDGVAGEESRNGVAAHRGSFAKVEAGGSLSSGADLATDGNGRAVVAGAGDTVVARALEGATSGDVFWIAFTGA